MGWSEGGKRSERRHGLDTSPPAGWRRLLGRCLGEGVPPWSARLCAPLHQCLSLRRRRQPRGRLALRGAWRGAWVAAWSAPLIALPVAAATLDRARFPRLLPPPGVPRLEPRCQRVGERHYAVIVVGDEPAAVMTVLELRRQFDRVPGLRQARLALVTDADLSAGIGGTLVRSGLAYLDRNQVPADMVGPLPPLAPSSDLYARFLKLVGAHAIAVEPQRASRAFARALQQARIERLPRAALLGVRLHGRRICTVQTRRYGSLGAELLIDASLGGALTELALVPRLPGMGGGRLSDQSLSLGWIFELEGFSYGDLLRLESRLTRRLMDPRDAEAQRWLQLWPQYRNDRQRLRADLLTPDGRPKLAFSSTSDSIDQRSPALAIAFHGQSRLPPGLEQSPVLLDAANIAVIGDRLSVNALLFRNDAAQNRAVLASGNRPLPWMRPAAAAVSQFFRRQGVRRVVWSPELYVRSAEQIAHPLEALSAERMAAGGVPRREALGTFTYALDFRGSLAGWWPKAKPTFNFGYRHTLPREISNLAVLGPASGFAGFGAGAGRIVELNVSVGQGLAIASTLALQRRMALAAVDPEQVARLMPAGDRPYGRPATATPLQLWWLHLDHQINRAIPGADPLQLPWLAAP